MTWGVIGRLCTVFASNYAALKRELSTSFWLPISRSYLFSLSWRHYLRRGHTSPEIRTDNSEITADNRCGVHRRVSVGMSVWQRHPTPPSRTERASYSSTRSSKYSWCSVWGSNRGYGSSLRVTWGRDDSVLRWNEPVSLRTQVLQVPVGHPKIHVDDACRDKQSMLSKEGLIGMQPYLLNIVSYSVANV